MKTSFFLLNMSWKTSNEGGGGGFSASRSQERSDRWLLVAVLKAIGMTGRPNGDNEI